eukprot:gene4223-biopygen23393
MPAPRRVRCRVSSLPLPPQPPHLEETVTASRRDIDGGHPARGYLEENASRAVGRWEDQMPVRAKKNTAKSKTAFRRNV